MINEMLTEKQIELLFDLATRQAKESTCLRRKCGAVVVRAGEVIGAGYNGPPQNNLDYRRCQQPLDKTKKYPTDKTCCVHAEVRALQDALEKHPDKIKGSDLFFSSVNESGEMLFSTKPYCTICSKMALDLRVNRFWLLSESGYKGYDTFDYHELSRASA